jgi:GntR family transcriptional regulator, transcriptional repressor for pyruvate dehydrogenase complex
MIAGILRNEIVTGVVGDGERLGSGPELVERFGVSRPTLREAFRILEAERLISIERGVYGGVVARRPDEAHTVRAMATVLQSRRATLSDVYEARSVIEPAAVRLLAGSRGRKGKVRSLQSIIDREIATVDDPSAYAAATIDFHEELIGASGNKTLLLLAEVLHDLVATTVTTLTEQDTDDRARERRLAGIDAHQQVLSLIDAGDALEAERFWRQYMDLVGSIMLRRGGERTVVSQPEPAPS